MRASDQQKSVKYTNLDNGCAVFTGHQGMDFVSNSSAVDNVYVHQMEVWHLASLEDTRPRLYALCWTDEAI